MLVGKITVNKMARAVIIINEKQLNYFDQRKLCVRQIRANSANIVSSLYCEDAWFCADNYKSTQIPSCIFRVSIDDYLASGPTLHQIVNDAKNKNFHVYQGNQCMYFVVIIFIFILLFLFYYFYSYLTIFIVFMFVVDWLQHLVHTQTTQ